MAFCECLGRFTVSDSVMSPIDRIVSVRALTHFSNESLEIAVIFVGSILSNLYAATNT